MKIIEKAPSSSRASEIRAVCKEICGMDRAVFVELPREKAYFDKVARAAGYSVKTKIQLRGGWCIWVKSEKNRD